MTHNSNSKSEPIFDRDKHQIGKLEMTEKEDSSFYYLEINGQYAHHKVTALPEQISKGVCGYSVFPKEGGFPVVTDDEEKREERLLQTAEGLQSGVVMLAEELRDSSEEGSRAKTMGQGILDNMGMEAVMAESGEDDLARRHKNVWTTLYNVQSKRIGELEEGCDGFLQVYVNSKCLDIFFKFWHYPNAEPFEGQDIRNQICIANTFTQLPE